MKKLLKSIKIFQSYDHKCTATFLWFTVYVVLHIRIPAFSTLQWRMMQGGNCSRPGAADRLKKRNLPKTSIERFKLKCYRNELTS